MVQNPKISPVGTMDIRPGEEGLWRIALRPSVPDEGSQNSSGDGGVERSGTPVYRG